MSISSTNRDGSFDINSEKLKKLNDALHILDPLRSFTFVSPTTQSTNCKSKLELTENNNLDFSIIKILFLIFFFYITAVLALIIMPIVCLMRFSLENDTSFQAPLEPVVSDTTPHQNTHSNETSNNVVAAVTNKTPLETTRSNKDPLVSDLERKRKHYRDCFAKSNALVFDGHRLDEAYSQALLEEVKCNNALFKAKIALSLYKFEPNPTLSLESLQSSYDELNATWLAAKASCKLARAALDKNMADQKEYFTVIIPQASAALKE